MSVKRDTTPRTTTFAVSPYARDRRAPAMGSRRRWMEQERHGNHGVHHHEQCALVPVASAIRYDRRKDGLRQGQRGEIEDFKVDRNSLSGQQLNEDADRR